MKVENEDKVIYDIETLAVVDKNGGKDDVEKEVEAIALRVTKNPGADEEKFIVNIHSFEFIPDYEGSDMVGTSLTWKVGTARINEDGSISTHPTAPPFLVELSQKFITTMMDKVSEEM